LVIQNFRPVSSQWSPLRSAFVSSAKASLPHVGGVELRAQG
jgi:hypothetical protein